MKHPFIAAVTNISETVKPLDEKFQHLPRKKKCYPSVISKGAKGGKILCELRERPVIKQVDIKIKYFFSWHVSTGHNIFNGRQKILKKRKGKTTVFIWL